MKKLELIIIFCMSTFLLGITFLFISEPSELSEISNCTFWRRFHTVKEHSAEDDILELVDFFSLNHKHEFEIFPELDGIDFFARSLNEDTCQFGFKIDLDNKNNLIIKHISDEEDKCTEVIEKVVADFQHKRNLPKNLHIEEVCDAYI